MGDLEVFLLWMKWVGKSQRAILSERSLVVKQAKDFGLRSVLLFFRGHKTPSIYSDKSNIANLFSNLIYQTHFFSLQNIFRSYFTIDCVKHLIFITFALQL
jgi:hypothetical protein